MNRLNHGYYESKTASTRLQRTHIELAELIHKIYPEDSMSDATKKLARDIYNGRDFINELRKGIKKETKRIDSILGEYAKIR